MKKVYIALSTLSLLPAVAMAQTFDVSSFQGVYDTIVNLINNYIFPILLAIAVLVIAWGIFKFILAAGDEGARAEGRSFILWGIVGLFLMLSIWGLVNILYNSFKLNRTPQAPTQGLVPNFQQGTS